MITTPAISRGHICFRQGYEYFHGDAYVFLSEITNPVIENRRTNSKIICSIEEWNLGESGKLFPINHRPEYPLKGVELEQCTKEWKEHHPPEASRGRIDGIKTYLKTIKVQCPKCSNIHDYTIRVQGITGARIYASRAVDCDHHCKTCGKSLEPLGYVPDQKEANLKRIASDLRKLQKGVIKNRIFVTPDGMSKIRSD